jgi:hypothetical protein
MLHGLQPNFKLVGDFLENCFVWYFSTAHIADGYSTAGRSPDDVVPEVARMSEAKSGRSRPNALPAMAGVRSLPPPKCGDR